MDMELQGKFGKNADLAASIGLTNLGEQFWNLSPAELVEDCIILGEGMLTDTGALAIETGEFTGRSPKDRFIVRDEKTEDAVWWGNVNIGFTPEQFDALYDRMNEYLNGKDIYVRDVAACAEEKYRMNIRVVTELPWSSLFANNMFLRLTDSEIETFMPEWHIVCVPSFQADPAIDGTRQANFAILNFTKKMILIGGTGYTGEIKKGIFSALNFILPHEKNVLSMHCSANIGEEGDTAVFFGLSGTGKTTLSTDPKRELIGDDEHGWDNEGVFNFEGGCYAKTIDLSKENEPDIYGAIKKDALLENVTLDENGKIDFKDGSVTQNTRVSYPINHIQNIVKPVSKAGHATKVIFLTADAFGVMPPVSKLTPEQTKYYFLSGFTAKLAGTERGVTEPQPTFSACFGKAFLSLHPTKYGEELVKKMEQHKATAYMVNTGWNGTGKRISIKDTRAIIDAILDGSIEKAETKLIPIFNFEVPTALHDVNPTILDPRDTYANPGDWTAKASNLAGLFIKNFLQYTDNEEGQNLVQSGPQL